MIPFCFRWWRNGSSGRSCARCTRPWTSCAARVASSTCVQYPWTDTGPSWPPSSTSTKWPPRHAPSSSLPSGSGQWPCFCNNATLSYRFCSNIWWAFGQNMSWQDIQCNYCQCQIVTHRLAYAELAFDWRSHSGKLAESAQYLSKSDFCMGCYEYSSCLPRLTSTDKDEGGAGWVVKWTSNPVIEGTAAANWSALKWPANLSLSPACLMQKLPTETPGAEFVCQITSCPVKANSPQRHISSCASLFRWEKETLWVLRQDKHQHWQGKSWPNKGWRPQMMLRCEKRVEDKGWNSSRVRFLIWFEQVSLRASLQARISRGDFKGNWRGLSLG